MLGFRLLSLLLSSICHYTVSILPILMVQTGLGNIWALNSTALRLARQTVLAILKILVVILEVLDVSGVMIFLLFFSYDMCDVIRVYIICTILKRIISLNNRW